VWQKLLKIGKAARSFSHELEWDLAALVVRECSILFESRQLNYILFVASMKNLGNKLGIRIFGGDNSIYMGKGASGNRAKNAGAVLQESCMNFLGVRILHWGRRESRVRPRSNTMRKAPREDWTIKTSRL
jgi:hypothetical protein